MSSTLSEGTGEDSSSTRISGLFGSDQGNLVFLMSTCGRNPSIACFMFFFFAHFPPFASLPWLCLLCVHDQGKCFDFKFIFKHQTVV